MSRENLLSSIKNLVSTGTSIALTRLELFSIDVQIARSKFFSLFVMIMGALFFFFLAIVMFALFIVIYYWESDRILALGFLTGSSLFCGLILALLIMQSLRTMPKLFEASIAEFVKDREALAK